MAIVQLNEKWEYTIDELVDQLARPTFVLRMARPLEHTSKSARTRARKARAEIRDIIRELAWKY